MTSSAGHKNGVCVWLCRLVDTVLPEELRAAIINVGIEKPIDTLDDAPASTLLLLWVDEDWDAGTEAIDLLITARLRKTTVLVGRETPPESITRNVRDHGGLACLTTAVLIQLLPQLIDAVHRTYAPGPSPACESWERLRESVQLSPTSALLVATETLGELLDSDAVALVPERGLNAILIERRRHLEDPDARQDQREPIPNLSQRALASGEIEVVCSLPHDDAPANSYHAAIAIPYAMQPATPSTSSRSDEAEIPHIGNRGAIHLYWRDARVPSVPEMHEAAKMRAFFNATMSWLLDCVRLVKTWQDSIRVFDETGARLGELPQSRARDKEDGATDTRLAGMISRLLRTCTGFPGVEALYARVSTQSFEPNWYREPEGSIPASVPWASDLDFGVGFVPECNAWAVVKPVIAEPRERPRDSPMDSQREPMGAAPHRLVALFTTPETATHYEQAIEALAGALTQGLHQFRRLADRRALSALADTFAEIDDPRDALEQMAEIVKQAMGAHGISIWLETSKGDEVLEIERVQLRTVAPARGLSSQSHRVAAARTLADWVVKNEQWLLLSTVDTLGSPTAAQILVGPLGTPSTNPPQVANGTSGSMLLVPMRSRKEHQKGVLAVWRDASRAPFDVFFDRRSLAYLAPQIAWATRRARELGALHKQLEATVALARGLHQPDITLPMADALIVKNVLALANADLVVLLRSDGAQPCVLYYAHHEVHQNFPVNVDNAIRDLHIRIDGTLSDGLKRAVDAVRRCIPSEAGLVPLTPIPFENTVDGALSGYVVCLHREGESLASSYPRQATCHFLQYASTMIQSHISVISSFLRDEIFKEQRSTDELLRTTAENLVRMTGADAALVYHRNGPDIAVKHVFPMRSSLQGLEINHESLTWKSIEAGSLRRVLNTQDHADQLTQHMNRPILERMTRAFGWSRVRSFLCCPIQSRDNRTVGVIKLLTSEHGRFLGEHDEALAKQVADAVAWELERLDRRLMLEELNHLAAELSARQGEELARAMVEGLEIWCRRYLRPKCNVYVLATTTANRLVVSRGSGSLDTALAKQLRDLSTQLGTKPCCWNRYGRASVSPDGTSTPLPVCGMAVPCTLPGEKRLRGHFFALHGTEQRFSDEDMDIFREAAREFAILLNGERLRQQWLEEIAMFRHEFLGPANGLQSAARAALLEAQLAGADNDEIQRIEGLIDAETSNIRMWRENQRLYFEDRLDLRPSRRPLRPIVERCVERFRSVARQRRIDIQLDWHVRGSIDIPIDEAAFDVALSNLIDNACKYSFANQILTIGTTSDRQHAIVWIEDVGHSIPDDLEVYKPGKRSWRDRARTIQGQGLGLTMAHAVIEAHDGELFHTCEPISPHWRPEVDSISDRGIPFRVRFTVKLPHRWRR